MDCYITLDYELGMGKRTGTPEKCLVEPMNNLTGMTEKYGVKMNVFVDAAYLLQMHKFKDHFPKLQKDYETVTNHIRFLDLQGHSIQLHLHPQWCYSTFDGDKWILDMDHYKLSDMPLDDQKRLIIEGTNLLNSFLSKKVSAFRAGGYSLGNYKDLYETFLSVGIVNDTSVLRGAYQQGNFQQYDYRNVPIKTSYRISECLTKEDETGQITEYPINTKYLPYIIHFFKKYLKIGDRAERGVSRVRWGDGIGIGYPGNKFQKIIKQISKFFSIIPVRACMDECYTYENVYNYSRTHYTGGDFIIIGHPKLISPCSIKILEEFIRNHSELEFKVFSSIK